MKKTGIFLACWLLVVPFCLAQKFGFTAKVEQAPEDGFYRILLNPEIQNRLNAAGSDIRLYDWKNREVPYLLDKTKAVQTQTFFREYPIVQKEIIPNRRTSLVVHNPARTKISNLSLVIKNTNVPKKASLSGSSDAQNWYALEANFMLQSVSSATETSEVKVISFPLSDYEYYRLEINDSASAPLNILAAGYYDFGAVNGQYTQVPGLTYTRSDSSLTQTTWLAFKSVLPISLDNLQFGIDSPAFFLRNATVLVPQTLSGRRGRSYTELTPVSQFQLVSDSKNTLELPGFRSREYYIAIANEDNPPLHIKSVKAFQLNTYLVANLKSAKPYELHFGDENAPAPSYDLVNFREKIPAEPPVLKPLELRKLTQPGSATTPVNTFFKDKIVIWIVLLGVLALLAFMTFKMMKETGNSPKQ
jgi:hypothetical protein